MTGSPPVDVLPVLSRATLGIELAAIHFACDIALIGHDHQRPLDRAALFGWALPTTPAPIAPNPLRGPVTRFRHEVGRIAVQVRQRLADRAPDLPTLVNLSRQVVDLRGRMDRDQVLVEASCGRRHDAAHQQFMTAAHRLTWHETALLVGHTVSWSNSGSAPTPVRIVDVLPGACVLVHPVDDPDGEPVPVHPTDLS